MSAASVIGSPDDPAFREIKARLSVYRKEAFVDYLAWMITNGALNRAPWQMLDALNEIAELKARKLPF